MSRLEEQITIDAPAREVWDQLHRVEDYPLFMDGVRRSFPRDGEGAHLDVTIHGAQRGMDTLLSDRSSGQEIDWQTEGAPDLNGTLSVRPVDAAHSQVQVRMEYEPEAIHHTFGGPKGMAQVHRIENTVRADLGKLKALVEGPR
ncbi:cyclase [Streptacidiphilus pinicola]|uniref:Cyclase n=1 Tax=Streptacidiphilus pinicola TaxID=2219663 RepID=A0A2X0KBJ5_9ACTN|nr:SRPBCC family protein [Streptacidiphilus pinicola]RAG86465.1 cyclase [Streptacidiphilus pinicola]